tara:strand:+ start:3232 stop:4314 length:1083 start_codon:yes stop_codon:yes gene_type:complete
MTNIRNALNDLGSAIEDLQNKTHSVVIKELSGDKVSGGTITNFASTGINDAASNTIVVVKNDGMHLETLHVDYIAGPLSVSGSLTVSGDITADKLHVKELVADVKHERLEPLSFISKNKKNTAYGKGLVWPGGEYTKQFLLMERPDRFFATESIELRANKIYMINGQNVLSQNALGNTVTQSNLRSVGTLESLNVETNLTVDNFLHYNANTQGLGLGTDSPNGALGISSWDHEFIVAGTDDRKFKIGTYTTGALQIITDDTPRITIDATGAITAHKKVVIEGALGVGVKNFTTDVDITTAGPVRFQNKKFEVAGSAPESGNYVIGDVVWNDRPTPNGYVGWINTKSGTPGTWKPFGQIAS